MEIIHDCRLAARELGRRLAERSGGRPDDLWFVTAEELDDFRDDPAAFSDLVASRRATRDAARRVGASVHIFWRGPTGVDLGPAERCPGE